MTYEQLYQECMELSNGTTSVKMNFDNVICVIESEHGFTVHCLGGFNLFLTHEEKQNILGNLKKGVNDD